MQILAKHTVRIGVQCSIGKALPQLAPEILAGVETAMNNANISAASIARALADPGIGHKVTPDSICKHRRQECGCFK